MLAPTCVLGLVKYLSKRWSGRTCTTAPKSSHQWISSLTTRNCWRIKPQLSFKHTAIVSVCLNFSALISMDLLYTPRVASRISYLFCLARPTPIHIKRPYKNHANFVRMFERAERWTEDLNRVIRSSTWSNLSANLWPERFHLQPRADVFLASGTRLHDLLHPLDQLT